ncbi:MAG: class I SAM-dependent methyltransferase [Thermoproteota archaeon]
MSLHIGRYFKRLLRRTHLLHEAESHVEIKGFLAKYYDTLLDIATLGFYKKFLKDVISKMNIQSSDRILDLGAGTGRNDVVMLSYLEEGEVIGLEIGEEMKNQFQEKSHHYNNLKLRDLRIEEKLPFQEEFDKVFISFVLHGFKQQDRIKIIENAYKALKKKGKFFILDYNQFDLSKKPAYAKFLFDLECDLAKDYIKRNWRQIWKEHRFSVQNEYLYFLNFIRLLELEKY